MKLFELANINVLERSIKNTVDYSIFSSPGEWIKNSAVDFVEVQKEQILTWISNGVFSLCDVGCVICVMICGMAILWFVIDQKGSTPRKYISGSYIFYMGMRLVQFVIS